MTTRYAINDQAVDWSAAEAQVAKLAGPGGKHGKSTVVSVKTGTAPLGNKRKANDAAGDAQADTPEREKKTRRSGKKVKR